eukprot:scaffold39389_cov60-Phaeocystis_antarctica.AAC.1
MSSVAFCRALSSALCAAWLSRALAALASLAACTAPPSSSGGVAGGVAGRVRSQACGVGVGIGRCRASQGAAGRCRALQVAGRCGTLQGAAGRCTGDIVVRDGLDVAELLGHRAVIRLEPATVGEPGCNRRQRRGCNCMQQRLQPKVAEAATVCNRGCCEPGTGPVGEQVDAPGGLRTAVRCGEVR